MTSRRAQVSTAAVAAMVALSVLFGALASLARRGGSAEPAAQVGGPYIESFEGAAQRSSQQARVATPRSGGAAAAESTLGGTANAPGGATGAPAAVLPAASAPPGRLALAPNAPRLSAAVSTELGRELAQLLANADVSVLAIGHQGGSFAYSQTDGWLRLDGNSWVKVEYSALPADLRAAYPPEVYAGHGSANLQAGKAAGARQSREGGPSTDRETAVPFDLKKAVVAYEPTPLIEQEPGKKSKQAAPVGF